ncbi:MAG: threonylcarbamoyl-AMP synthase [Bdellovibrionales bacterium]|nr:threonylcarbamoyl-AMP synthase [Bdellovibrionales bacterium]
MIFQSTPENIKFAARILQEGDLVGFPTETVYGLGANAYDEQAVRKIFQAKGRPFEDPLIVHVDSIDKIKEVAIVKDSSELEAKISQLQIFWPGPLSVILPKRHSIPDVVTAGRNTVAVRIPNHPVALELIRIADVPIAAPSANPFGYVSPTTAQHVHDNFGKSLRVILDGGSCTVGVESSVLDLTTTPPKLLRPGGATLEELQLVIGPIKSFTPTNHKSDISLSPGLSDKHYSPRTKLLLYEDLSDDLRGKKLGLIQFSRSRDVEAASFQHKIVLSPVGNLSEVAAKLYAAIRKLDLLGLDAIVVESCENKGIGRAIMDRLTRAACDSEH